MTTFEDMGVTYSKVGDYYLPDIILPEEQHYSIGRFGLMRRDYLKNHRKVMYINLLTSGALNEHLYEIDQTANTRMEALVKQMAKNEDVTEQLKAENQMLWVQKMNNIRNRALGIIRDELIFV